MAGSFDIFRRYQKAALAGLAIMAMLAFFVLPPVLQMGSAGGPKADTVVVTWKGESLRESGLERAVVARRALNQFLMALQAAASGSERVQPPLRDDEKAVVDSLLMAREAEANGIVVSDAVINDFLAIWTGDRVPQADIRGVIDQLRERAGVTEQDIFDGLRTLLLGERMQALALRGTGFASAPPGWRWDAFRRLEQSATVEVVPVIVESLGGEVAEPTTAALEAVYAKYKEDLPRAESDTPGFREPARIRYDALVATPDVFVAEAEKTVTEEQIAKFYEANKDALYKQVTKPDEAAAKKAEPDKAGEKAGDPKAGAQATPPATQATPEAKPAGRAEGPPAAEPEAAKPAAPAPAAPAEPTPTTPEGDPEASDPKAATGTRAGVIRAVAFRQPGEAVAEAAKEPAKEVTAAADGAPAAPPPATGEKPAAGEPAKDKEPVAKDGDKPAATPETKPEEKPAYEPLDKVRDDIRKRLAREAADKKLGEIFDKVAGRIATYADDVELALGVGEPVPPAPSVEKLAAEHGLEAVRSDFVDASDAIAAGGVGTSFQLSFSQPMGVRQVQWADMLFSPDAARWRPVATRDFAGNRYLSWKTEDRPEFTPAFADVRDDVERVWRLMEARPLAKQRAEKLAAAAAGKELTAAIAGQEGVEITKVGPFTWLTRGTAPFGSAPVISQPAGVQMAGAEFMEAVFGLEPGGTATAFNEPKTICYCIRLVAYEPEEAILQERFTDDSADPRRLAMLADDEVRDVRDRWMAGIEKRYGVEWKRDPR
ncbi:MAG: hypothetical protein EBX35_02205 [Planctomycetia bacterium]|nr:hypothetical protein [Planctomycetia bacterium]